jgi:C4-dicarboxylate transporter DctM subunit
MMTLIFFGILAVAIILGVPIGFALAITGLLYLMIDGAPSLGIVAQRMVSGIDSFTLLALPFFILAGDLMAYGTTQRLMNLANAFLGQIRGGLAVSAVAASAFFGAISGSGVATSAAVGSLMEPEMVKKGYSKGFTASLLAGTGALGIVIPPSLSMVVYGVAAETSIGDLFLAGFIPGLLTCLFLAVYSIYRATKDNIPRERPMSLKEKGSAIKNGILPLLMPVIIMGGVMSGIFTPTESAVVAVVYAFILARFVYKELDMKKLVQVVIKSAKSSAVLLFIIAASTPFGWVMSVEQIPQTITKWMFSITSNDIIMMLLILFLILLLGTFMETITIIIIITPILLPVVQQMGMDLIHFGVIMMVGLAIGGATPPLAVNLFVTTRIIGIKQEDTFPEIIYICLVMTAALVVIAFVPGLSLWLPSLFK